MPYLEEMLKEAKNLDLSKPQVFQMDVAHDEWCALLNGKGKCNCSPIVTTEGKSK